MLTMAFEVPEAPNEPFETKLNQFLPADDGGPGAWARRHEGYGRMKGRISPYSYFSTNVLIMQMFFGKEECREKRADDQGTGNREIGNG